MDNLSSNKDLFKDNFDSIEGLADRIAEILECPITIEDSNHRIISYSKHEENVDDARVATIIQRKVPEKVINGLWKSGVMSKLFENGEPVIIPAIASIGLGNRIAISVWKNNEILGFIWAQTNDKPVGENKLLLLKEAAKLVQKQLLKHKIKRKKAEENYQEFFWQLLTGHLQQADIERQAKRYRIQLDGKLAIALIEFDEELTEAVEKHAYYLTETLQLVQIVCRVFDQNQLILLIRLGHDNEAVHRMNQFIEDFIHKISERLQLDLVKGAYGLIYHSPQYIPASYKQALKVLELKDQFSNELSQIYGYQQLGIYQFLDELVKIRDHDHYQNYSIEKLREYDSKHNADLLATLKVYLDCDSNVHQAAKLMHVHTNTLNYRLKRIVEIAEIDLKDPNQKTTLYLDLKIENIKRNDM